jgi:hypothetical protein
MAGFEDQGLAEVPTLDYSDGGADTVASPVASGGSTRSLRLDASTEAVSLPLASVNKLSLSNTVGAIGFKAYFTDVTGNGNTIFCQVRNGSDPDGDIIFSLRWNISDNIDVLDSAGSVVRTITAPFSINTWYKIEVGYLSSPTVGTLELFIDKISQGLDTGLDTGTLDHTGAGGDGDNTSICEFIGIDPTAAWYVDDYYSGNGTIADNVLGQTYSDWNVFGYQADVTGTTPDEGDVLDAGDFGNINDTPLNDGTSAAYTANAAASCTLYCDAANSGGLGPGPNGDANVTGSIIASLSVYRADRTGGSGTTHGIGYGKRTTAPATTMSYNTRALTTSNSNYSFCADVDESTIGDRVPAAGDYICLGFNKTSGGRDFVCWGAWGMVLHVVSGVTNVDLDASVAQSLTVNSRQNVLRPLDSLISQVLTVAGEINLPINLDGLIATSLTAQGRLNSLRPLDASIDAGLSVVGRLGAFRPIDGIISQALTVNPELAKFLGLDASIDQSMSVQTEAQVFRGLYASIVTNLAVTGILNAPINLDGIVAHALSIGADASRLRSVDSSIDSALTLDARLNALRPIDAIIAQALTVAGELSKTLGLESVISQSMSIGSELAMFRGLESSIDQSLVINSRLGQFRPLDASIDQSLTVNGDFSRLRSINSNIGLSLTVAGEIATTAAAFVDLDGSIAQSLSIVSALNVIRPIESSISTSLSVAGKLGPLRGLDAAIPFSSSIQAELGPLRGLSAIVPSSLTVNSALGAIFDIDALISSNLSIAGELDTVSGVIFVDLDGSLSHSLSVGSSLNIIRPIDSIINTSLSVIADIQLIRNLVSQIVTGLTVAAELDLSLRPRLRCLYPCLVLLIGNQGLLL